MIRVAVLLSLFAATEARAQVVTRPTFAVTAGVLRNPGFYTEEGTRIDFDSEEFNFSYDDAVSTAYNLAAEVPVVQRRGAGASAGVRLRAATESFDTRGPGWFNSGFSAQSVDVFGRVGNRNGSLVAGVSFDLDDSLFANGLSTTDGLHAIFGQLREVVPVGPVLAFAEVNLAHPFDRTVEAYGSLDESGEFVPARARIDGGDLYGAQVGGSIPAGPVVVGLALSYAGRTKGTVEYLDTDRTGLPSGVRPFGLGYEGAVSVLPSVTWQPSATRLVVRADGSFSGLSAMEGIPVGFTLGGENAPVIRPALTLSVGVGL